MTKLLSEELFTHCAGSLAAISLAVLAVSRPASAAPAAMVYWENSSSNKSFAVEIGQIQQLATDTWSVDATGKLTGVAPTAELKFAAKHHIQSFATISNFGITDFDPAIVHAILTNPLARSKMFAGMSSVATINGYDGINIDFESVSPADRGLFTKFVNVASAYLHARGKYLVLSVPAMLQNDPTDSWTGAYDLAALSRAVDIVQYMTYDENGPWGTPGPVAGLDWVSAAAHYAISVVPPAKISLGVPAYGYDWNLTAGTGSQVPWNQIPALLSTNQAAPLWDAASSSPYFNYTLGGDQHVVWYENYTSIERKAALASAMKLAGVSVYALGYEDPNFWAALKQGGQ